MSPYVQRYTSGAAFPCICASLGWCGPGRWRGTLVAIKVVEHAPGAGMEDQAEKMEREALLATSLIHPNVVTTFKACRSDRGPNP